MTDIFNKTKNVVKKFTDLTTLGAANLTASGISAIFWFYMAALLGTEHYGEVSYFIAIAGIASVISFLGTGTAIVVYTAKEVKIQATIHFITIISGTTAAIVLFFFLHNAGVSLYVIGYVIFTLATNELLGRKLYKKY